MADWEKNGFFHSLEPPEMNTSQLLLVSSVGLGVNLFGMFAMGGHHHHHHHVGHFLFLVGTKDDR